MQPMPELKTYWAMMPDDKEQEALYLSGTEQFQRAVNYVATASESELE